MRLDRLFYKVIPKLGRKENRKSSAAETKFKRQHKNNKAPSMPLLYSLVRSWAWEAVTFRCTTHPHEASETIVDELGETCLHWACLGKPPLETVQAILNVCPKMAEARNHAGHLPLHIAISYRASPDVVRALMAVFPDSSGLPNGAGSYPLHLLCDYGSSVDSLRAVLETPAGAQTITAKDRATGLPPLCILNARKNGPQFRRALASMREARKRQHAMNFQRLEDDGSRQQEGDGENNSGENEQHSFDVSIRTSTRVDSSISNLDSSNQSNTSTSGPARTGRRGGTKALMQRQERMIASFQQNDFWQKAALLVLVEYTRQPLTEEGLDSDQVNIVHACAGSPSCSASLLGFAILLHTDDLMNRFDQRGRLPLHVASATHASSLLMKKDNGKVHENRDRSEEILLTLLDANPQAAFVPDHDGNVPFVVALQEQQRQFHQQGGKAWSFGLQRLLAANLSALEAINLDESLYPFLLANRMGTIDNIFSTLRGHPNLLHNRGSFCSRKNEILLSL
jgi:hypothetical protein